MYITLGIERILWGRNLQKKEKNEFCVNFQKSFLDLYRVNLLYILKIKGDNRFYTLVAGLNNDTILMYKMYTTLRFRISRFQSNSNNFIVKEYCKQWELFQITFAYKVGIKHRSINQPNYITPLQCINFGM